MTHTGKNEVDLMSEDSLVGQKASANTSHNTPGCRKGTRLRVAWGNPKELPKGNQGTDNRGIPTLEFSPPPLWGERTRHQDSSL